MADLKRIDPKTGTSTVGHEWDGIEELDTPMPRWWLWTFYATVIFAIGYCVAYPAWPLIDRATSGALGWTSHGDLERDLAAERARRADVVRALAGMPIEELPNHPDLLAAAEQGGRSAFKVNCAACHGAGAAGSPGYPNLNDDDWLWGGSLSQIEATIRHGVRQPGDDSTHQSMMPAFGRDGMLNSDQIDDVVSFVRTLSGQDRASASSRRGAGLFATNCAACHGPGGEGNRDIGAPRLSDGIWLYGGDRTALTATVHGAHAGMMPAWADKLDPVTIKMLAAYVHSLGGGEAARPAPAPAPSPAN
jgi:cytochrome c oxidase cbb3-type subunit 3